MSKSSEYKTTFELLQKHTNNMKKVTPGKKKES